jgi:20S proteasome subunit alpha 5
MSLKDAEILCLRVLKQVMEEKLDQNNVQLATVTPRVAKDGRPSGQFAIMKEDQLQALIAEM